MILQFTVYGAAQPKGSTRAFLPKGWNRPIVTSDNPKNKGWQQLVAEAASQAIRDRPTREAWSLLSGGVRLTLAFYLPAPKKYQTAKYRATMPAHVTKPDSSKLLRSVEDALKHVAWHDDSQVVDIVLMKRYAAFGDVPHVDVRIEPTAGVNALVSDQPLFEMAR